MVGPRLLHEHRTGSVPRLGLTVGELLDAAASATPGADALVVRDRHLNWSYSRLRQEADSLAAGLLALGLDPGARIGIRMPGCAEWVVIRFASAKAGLVLVPLDPAWRTPQVHRALARTQCQALLTTRHFGGDDQARMLYELLPELHTHRTRELHAASLPSLRHVVALSDAHLPGMHRYVDVVHRGCAAGDARLDAVSARLRCNDPVSIEFASAVTAAATVTLTHRDIVDNAERLACEMDLTTDDRLCIPGPLHHWPAVAPIPLACVARGAGMVLPGASFDAGALLDTLRADRCTGLCAEPAMFAAVLEHPNFAPGVPETLRTGIIAGAPCTDELMHRIVDEMHLSRIVTVHGMSTSGVGSPRRSVRDPQL